MIRYINLKNSQGIETVDEIDSKDFPTLRAFKAEVKRLVKEYNQTPGGVYYASQKSTRAWRER
jgi:hypothetical protein